MIQLIYKNLQSQTVLLIFYFISAKALITYDQGYYNGFSLPVSPGFICKDNFQQIENVPFREAFANIPQVILGLEFLSFDKGINYKLSITSTTTTYFEIQIECITSIQVFSVEFSWYAIDDQRIQVINNFNMNPPDVKVFDHINPNFESGIVSITSLGIQGDIDFQLSISSITRTAVSVSITKVANKIINLTQIGYQVILGIQEAFKDSNNYPLSSAYNSGTLKQYSNRWLFLSFTGFNMSSTLKQKVTRYLSPLSYQMNTFDVGFVNCNHQISWLAYQFILKSTQINRKSKINTMESIQLFTNLLNARAQGYPNQMMLRLQQNLQYKFIYKNQILLQISHQTIQPTNQHQIFKCMQNVKHRKKLQVNFQDVMSVQLINIINYRIIVINRQMELLIFQNTINNNRPLKNYLYKLLQIVLIQSKYNQLISYSYSYFIIKSKQNRKYQKFQYKVFE